MESLWQNLATLNREEPTHGGRRQAAGMILNGDEANCVIWNIRAWTLSSNPDIADPTGLTLSGVGDEPVPLKFGWIGSNVANTGN